MKPFSRSAFDIDAAIGAPVVLGFSGGGDSTALLLDLARSGRPALAAIVDHGLREGSAEDALRAAAIAREAGVDAEIVTLTWADGDRRSQETARRARMAALAACARRAGAREIALAHTRDDQAETVLIRLAAGSSWLGLAAMAPAAPAPLWPEGRGLSLTRPLLQARRAALRQTLRDAGVRWIEDPANAQPRFARVRARALLDRWDEAGLGAERWAGLADRLAPHAAALDAAARALIERAAHFDGPSIRIDLAAFSAAAGVQARALAAIIAAAGAAARLPEEAAVQRALADPAHGRTLGGARLRTRPGALEIGRDPGGVLGRGRANAPAPLALPVGEAAVWDGRLALVAAEPGWRAAPAPDGQAPALRRGNALLSLEDAIKNGFIDAKWLLRERIAHLLWR